MHGIFSFKLKPRFTSPRFASLPDNMGGGEALAARDAGMMKTYADNRYVFLVSFLIWYERKMLLYASTISQSLTGTNCFCLV